MAAEVKNGKEIAAALEELREQKSRLERLLTGTMRMSERFARKVVGLSRSAYRRLPLAQTPDDPDADLRAELRSYSRKHPRHGFRRAWAWLGYDQGVWSTRSRSTACGRKRVCRSGAPHAANAPGNLPFRSSTQMLRMLCGPSTSSSTRPSAAGR
ncbi:hypothetical protein [Rhodococcus sp. 5G237]